MTRLPSVCRSNGLACALVMTLTLSTPACMMWLPVAPDFNLRVQRQFTHELAPPFSASFCPDSKRKPTAPLDRRSSFAGYLPGGQLEHGGSADRRALGARWNVEMELEESDDGRLELELDEEAESEMSRGRWSEIRIGRYLYLDGHRPHFARLYVWRVRERPGRGLWIAEPIFPEPVRRWRFVFRVSLETMCVASEIRVRRAVLRRLGPEDWAPPLSEFGLAQPGTSDRQPDDERRGSASPPMQCEEPDAP